jgi:hypothetical protein
MERNIITVVYTCIFNQVAAHTISSNQKLAAFFFFTFEHTLYFQKLEITGVNVGENVWLQNLVIFVCFQ